MNNIYRNPLFSSKERVQDLISQMTVEEKIGQMMQISFNGMDLKKAEEWICKKGAGSFLHVLGEEAEKLQTLAEATRLGIPLVFGIDATHGHTLHNGATVFPSPLAMSCSWNSELIEKAGRVTAKEVAADGLHWTFSPVLCIGRDLRWGRINETFGEDPYLIGILAAAMIRGYQGENLGAPDSILACAKHFIAYGESTGGRDSYDTEISMRKLREIFLPPFKQAIDAGCATFMAGYQSIDGIPMSANKKLLSDLLKEELGFKGFVVTDWNNTGSLITTQKVASDILAASKKVIDAGNDMIMNCNEFFDATLSLVKSGEIMESSIDEAVMRILQAKFDLGLFERRQIDNSESRRKVFACAKHLDVNLKLTRESIVLLENRNHLLPLDQTVKKIAVIGPNANDIQTQFGDWTFFSHPSPQPEAIPKIPVYTIFKGICELGVQRGVEVCYHRGCGIMDPGDQEIKQAVACAGKADVIITVVGDCLAQNGEFKDRADLSLSGSQQKLLESLKSLGKPLIVVLVNGKPLAIPWIAQNADAVIETFNSGMLGGKAVAEIIFGEVNPSGRLSISFPYHSGQLPVYYNQLPGWHGGKYMDMPAESLYSFGYGLSYSKFSYANLQLSKSYCTRKETIRVSIDVTNDGVRDGMETVQLYVRDLVSSVMAPVKLLKGYKKVEIKAGDTCTIAFSLIVTDLFIVDEKEDLVVEPGEFHIMVGPDARDESLLKTMLTVYEE